MTDPDALLDLIAAHLDELRAEAEWLARRHFPRLAARPRQAADRLEDGATAPEEATT